MPERTEPHFREQQMAVLAFGKKLLPQMQHSRGSIFLSALPILFFVSALRFTPRRPFLPTYEHLSEQNFPRNSLTLFPQITHFGRGIVRILLSFSNLVFVLCAATSTHVLPS
ncbi:MAG: hypothetical protein WA634_05350 [Silvibacterium sp.]